ncbi:helix-turn-helix domain-containing protein [Brevundimonas subvibrioides]|uniref:helix-turn-helix domain-containing protein n=1 Tax=Brevundimonas subvibrioides TaxID=74313 RepID=UPI0022B4CF13|nr:AraC family transcriptional regulator [Brevundimonas subvibrioides]
MANLEGEDAVVAAPPMDPTVSVDLVSAGQWSLCRMEHTVMGPVSFDQPPPPVHHLAMPLGTARPRMTMVVEGRVRRPAFGPDEIIAIEAGSCGRGGWDDAFESACFYFQPEAIEAALGRPVGAGDITLHTSTGLKAPIVVHLLQALHADAAAGQPHGVMVGDAIFSALAAQFVTQPVRDGGSAGADWRVRRALDYIHANLTDPIDLNSIAMAAATSPYHLARSFRAATGSTIWRYVLKQRARRAGRLMLTTEMSLTQVAYAVGFETYSSFVAAVREEYGMTPMALRRGR